MIKVESLERQLKAAAEEKATIDKEFCDTKEELQSVMSQLSELKENLQVEQKEKEVSVELVLSKCVWAVPLKKTAFLAANKYSNTMLCIRGGCLQGAFIGGGGTVYRRRSFCRKTKNGSDGDYL